MARIIALLALLLAAFTAAQAATVDPIVGKWMWGTRAAEVMPDHTATREFGTTGTWKFLEEGGSERTYQFSWENARLIDDVSLSEDRKTADVRSSLDEKYQATRIGAVPAAALPASGAGASAVGSEVARAQEERTAKYVKDLEALMRLLLEAKTPEFYKAVKAEHDAYADGEKTEGYPRSASVPGTARILRNVFEADLATIEKNGGAPRKPAIAAADPFDIPTKDGQDAKSNPTPSTGGAPSPTAPRKMAGIHGEPFPKATPAPAASQPPSIPPRNLNAATGKFYVNVDDELWLMLNGKELLHKGSLGKGESPDCTLAVGDRVTARLHNVMADRYLMLLFVSSDKRTLISFPHGVFKILPDPDATDFSAVDFGRGGKIAKEDRGRAKQALTSFPFKHHSEAVWGEQDDCSLGCIITPGMFAANGALEAQVPESATRSLAGLGKESSDSRRPPGFMEIPWGTSQEAAKAAMLSKPSVVLSKTSEDGNQLRFTGGTFHGRRAEWWELNFGAGKLVKGIVMITPSDLLRTYSDLKREMTSKYSKQSNEEYGGGIHYATYWSFRPKEGPYEWWIAVDVNTSGIRTTYEQRAHAPDRETLVDTLCNNVWTLRADTLEFQRDGHLVQHGGGWIGKDWTLSEDGTHVTITFTNGNGGTFKFENGTMTHFDGSPFASTPKQ